MSGDNLVAQVRAALGVHAVPGDRVRLYIADADLRTLGARVTAALGKAYTDGWNDALSAHGYDTPPPPLNVERLVSALRGEGAS